VEELDEVSQGYRVQSDVRRKAQLQKNKMRFCVGKKHFQRKEKSS
jgi:hypothetical protein